jgi:methylenetetrahydrofolate reductase (NADPH)
MKKQLKDALASAPTFSCEFFPPKTPEGEASLWKTLDELVTHAPDFVSVTYGAGGSTQDTSLAITQRIIEHYQLPTLAHLTCVGRTAAELQTIVDEFQARGVRDILALRGDPVAGPGTPWQTTPGGFEYAIELVQMLKVRGGFTIGVAAFPGGHPESQDLNHDAHILAMKQEAGADFAITNLFFEAHQYFDMIERASAHGCSMPIIPGLMPVTNVKQIERMTAMSGSALPQSLHEKFIAIAEDEKAVVELGIEVVTTLAQELLAGGAPGIHLYPLNRAYSAVQIFNNIR